MIKISKRLSALMLSGAIMFSTSTIKAEPALDLGYVDAMAEFIKDNYLYEVTDEQLTEGAIKGLFYHLDPYSNYYTAEEYKKLEEELTGEMQGAGIGVRIMEHSGYIKIIDVIKDTSAYKAGLKPEDIIISVNDESISGVPIDNVMALIKGEEGSKVKIGVVREGEKGTLNFDITRAKVIYNPIKSEVLEDNIGYIKIEEFNQHSFEEVSKALGEFESKGIYNVVFDVRDNPGGSLTEVINILRLIVPKGPIVHVKYSTGEEVTYKSFNESPKYKVSVMANKNSASASEIFAGAIKESGAGKVIGEKTYGKGSVQDIATLKDGGAVKLTIAEYFTPNRNKVNKVGIEPDILAEDDTMLEKTVEVLKNSK